VFLGNKAGYTNNAGKNNVFVGTSSGYSNTSGESNVFLGNQAGYTNSTGINNVFVGTNAGNKNSSGENNVFMGNEAGLNNNIGKNNVFLGSEAGRSNTTGGNNVFIGDSAGRSSISAKNNVILGSKAGFSNKYGQNNVFIGTNAGYNNIGSTGTWGGNKGIFIGYESGYNNTTGSHNIFFGEHAGYTNTTGSQNIFIGLKAGRCNTTDGGKVFIGTGAGENFKREHVEGEGVNGTLFIGDNCARYWETGTNNTIINSYASGVKDGSNNIFIGKNVFSLGTTVNNRLAIGSLIYGELDNKRVAINTTNANGKTFYVNGDAGGSGGWNQGSDKRLKTNIKPLEGALQSVLKLQGVTFNWIDETNNRPGRNVGFIAQEVKEIIPEIVNGGGKDEKGNEIYYSIEYATLTPVLVEAIKEQQEAINKLNAVNKEQQELIDKLIEELKTIKEQVKTK